MISGSRGTEDLGGPIRIAELVISGAKVFKAHYGYDDNLSKSWSN